MVVLAALALTQLQVQMVKVEQVVTPVMVAREVKVETAIS
jgi:hypothetical protein